MNQYPLEKVKEDTSLTRAHTHRYTEKVVMSYHSSCPKQDHAFKLSHH